MTYVSEAVGSFFLMFIIAVVVIGSGHASVLFVVVAVGIAVTSMVYAYGHISGGYYHPAITLAMFMRRRLSLVRMLLYWFLQILGAVAAVQLVLYINYLTGASPDAATVSPDIAKTFLAEFLCAFALSYTMVNVVLTRPTAFGLAIGITVMTAAYSLGVVAGDPFNPVVAIGMAQAGVVPWPDVWIYLAASLAGGAAAALAFKAVHPDK